MLARIFLFLNYFALSLLFVSSAQAATFLESGGVVVIEAESSSATGQWSRESKVGGAKGGAYLVWNGPDLFSGKNAGRDTLRYTFRVQKAGNYELRWRSYIAHGNNATEANDSWVRFPSGKNIGGQHAINGWTKVFQNQARQWSWSAKTVDHVGKSVRQFFSKGDHVIEISGRSHGHAIDRIVLFRYGEISYSANKFDAFGVSSTVGGSQPPQNTAPETVAKPEPTPVVVPKPEPVVVAEPEPEPTPVVVAEPEPEPVVQSEPVVETKPAPAAEPAQAEAPVLSVSGSTLSWNAVDAVSINIHQDGGAWLESIPGSATSWDAPGKGSYFVVATNKSDWSFWGRSNTVAVSAQSDDPAPINPASSASSTVSIDRFTSAVYSKTSAEIFWSVSGAADGVEFEVRRDRQLVFKGSAASHYENQLTAGTGYVFELAVLVNGEVADQREIAVVTRGGESQASAPQQDNSINLRGAVYSRTALELSWDRNDAAGQIIYNVYQDDQLVNSSDAVSYFADGLNAGQTYRFAVGVQDASGAEGQRYSLDLTTRGGEDAVYLVARSSNSGCDTCGSVDLQMQDANGAVMHSSDLFADIKLLGYSTATIDTAAMSIASSEAGTSTYVAAQISDANGGTVSIVEIDNQSGARLNTRIVDNAAHSEQGLSD